MNGECIVLYHGRQYAADAIRRREHCVNCGSVYKYLITRTGYGGGNSPFAPSNTRAADTARFRALRNLNRAINEAVETAHCRVCGHYQPETVNVLREQYGKDYEPNDYAAERISTPAEQAWQTARAQDTIEGYNYFKSIWPTRSYFADERIRTLKHPHRELVASVISGLYRFLLLRSLCGCWHRIKTKLVDVAGSGVTRGEPMRKITFEICERVAEAQALIHDHVECGDHTAEDVVTRLRAIFEETALLQAMYDVGYLPQNTPLLKNPVSFNFKAGR